MTVDAQQWAREKERDFVKDERRRYWRAREAIEDLSPDDDDRDIYVGYYQNVLGLWLMDLQAPLIRAAENGTEPYAELWSDTEFGAVTGLREVDDVLTHIKDDATLPVDVLHEVGEALETVSVQGYDLPEAPPVVEEPWSPDEIEPPGSGALAELLDPTEAGEE